MPSSGKLLLGLAFALAVCAQNPSPAPGRIATAGSLGVKRPQLVTLNIVAFDNHGQPVGDLTSDDFQIQDQGKRQQIVFFRRNQTKPQSQTADSHQYSNRSTTTVQQATVILLDLLNANLSDRGSGWEGIDRALEHLESADNLYLYLLTADGRLFPVHGLPEAAAGTPPGDRLWTRQIRSLLDQAIRTVNRLKPIDERDPMIRIQQTYHVLGQLAIQLAGIPGRKSVVWITHGVPITVLLVDNDRIDMTENVRKFAIQMNRAGVAMYTVDQGGPGSLPVDGSREGPGYQSQEALEQMSGLTGGRAYPGNHVEAAVPDAIASARGSYVIVYEPPPENWDSKFHKLRVSCTRKGIRIQAQQGYYAIPPGAGVDQMREAFESAASNPLDASGIGLRATVSPSPKAAHTLHYELRVDPADLLLSHQGDRESGQFAIGFVGLMNGRTEPASTAIIDVSLTPEQLAAAMKDGIPFTYDKLIGKDVQKVRIVVMDTTSLETGALTVPVQ